MSATETGSTIDPSPQTMSSRILILGVNWLGDAVMGLPAVTAFLSEHADARVSMLVKPPLVPFWRMVNGLHEVMELPAGNAGTVRAAATARGARFDRAFVLPNSFRSALIPFLARVPQRRGAASPLRRWLLTDAVAAPDAVNDARRHQGWEYMRLLSVREPPAGLSLPRLAPPPAVREACRARFAWDAAACWIGMLPGAARGPSKRWPSERFAEVGRRLTAERGTRIAVFGSPGEAGVCRDVARGIGEKALCLAGQTSLPELAALLSDCRAVLSNDSGGMHLAAAAGTPVVAVFGLTDPEVTGPIGPAHRVVAARGVTRSRAIPRQSAEAERALQSVTVEEVLAAMTAARAASRDGMRR